MDLPGPDWPGLRLSFVAPISIIFPTAEGVNGVRSIEDESFAIQHKSADLMPLLHIRPVLGRTLER